ncbi:hypothetical protein F6P80_10380, partial [Streptococcus suis]|nr:hypothetical protein [Streptococcus suis]
WLLFIIGHMGLFVYTQKASIISTVDLPTTEIIEPYKFDFSERFVLKNPAIAGFKCMPKQLNSTVSLQLNYPLRLSLLLSV